MNPEVRDVVIVGGGLAGLSLAIQLRRAEPGLTITVLERRRHPLSEAAHKVGESTVEIGGHYFADVLRLRAHLETHQLRKFGFRFFFSDRAARIDQVTELGAADFLPTGSFQIDRGRFENFLGEQARSMGIDFRDGVMVRGIELSDGAGPGEPAHQVKLDDECLPARWLIDASGRAGMLRRRLDLAEPVRHDAGAIWFRIADRIDVDSWSDDPQWRERCGGPRRWLSTIHLCGAGYWVWLIPLASGAHSIGIVADPRFHPIDSFNSFERAMDWFAVHQPQLHAALHTRRDRVMDFGFFRHFSLGCRRLFDGNARWAITGEAGVFLDPFYSPGSDYIGIVNTMITDLVRKDLARLPVAQIARLHERVLRTFIDSHWTLYEDQYPLFGHPVVMPAKVMWDYTYYWGVMAPLAMGDHLIDPRLMARLGPALGTAARLNAEMQRLLREWAPHCAPRQVREMLDQAAEPWFVELNRDLCAGADIDTRLSHTLRTLDAFALDLMKRIGKDMTVSDEACPEVRGARLRVAAAGGATSDPVPATHLFAALD